MSLADIFSYADSLFQSLVRNPPGEDWSVVSTVTFAYPSFAANDNESSLPRGRLEYSPGQIVRLGDREYVAPATFSGEVPATVWPTGTPDDAYQATVSVTVAAPTFLSSLSGNGNKYLLEATIPDVLSQSISEADELPAVYTTPGAVSVTIEEPPVYSNLIFWGPPYQYPFIAHKV
jgi:hypothetical protein